MSQDSEDDQFNRLTQQHNASNSNETKECRPGSQAESYAASGDRIAAKQKRIACIICRKRKLKCNGDRPTCGTCERLSHVCSYDEIRRKSGPKRGYVKELEARLLHVETELRSKERKASITTSPRTMPGQSLVPNPGFGPLGEPGMMGQDRLDDLLRPTASYNDIISPIDDAQSGAASDIDLGFGGSKTWEMIGLGLEEPLPPQETTDELTQIYFDKIHPSVPMIHRYRYLASMNLAPHMRPPICLRYIMWCLASSVSSKYFDCQDMFYQRSRKYADIDEMKGHGESFITIGHSQSWVLISTYEFRMMYFPRAWQSVGRAIRLAQMMGLHRLDGAGLAVKQALAPPRDWTDREERRRTFWMAYCADRYASIGTGWPMVVEDRDILTNLPATEEAYDRSSEQQTCSLTDAMTADGAASLSSLAGVVLMACLFGRNLTHLHRPDPNDREDDIKGEFWKRHRNMDNILLNTKTHLPSQLELPTGIRDSKIVFLHMNIHTSSICLHQAAIFKAEKHRLPPDLINQSKSRCLLAAQEVASIMRLVSSLDLAALHPFLAFCLYVAARVFVQALKRLPNDHEIQTSLEFLLNSMHALKRKNPLTESFLVQLAVDLESAGLNIPVQTSPGLSIGNSDCPIAIGRETPIVPIIEIREPAPLPLYAARPEAISRPVPIRSVSSPQSGYNLQGGATQYSLPTFDLVAQDHEMSTQVRRGPQEVLYQEHGLLVSQGWNSKDAGGLESDQLRNGQYDIEMSDQGSDRPQSYAPSQASNFSHRSSSNTSYSPTNDSDHNINDSRTAPSNSAVGIDTFFQPSVAYGGYSTPNTQFSAPLPRREAHDNYTAPLNWGLGNSGIGQDLTPGIQLADNGWSQLLQGMEWGGSSMISAEPPRKNYDSYNRE